MLPPNPLLMQNGPKYQILRRGNEIGTTHGLPDGKGEIMLSPGTGVQKDDVLVGIASRERFPVARIESEVQGTEILSQRVFNTEHREDHSRSNVTQHIGTVHGGVAGRDFHGNVSANLKIGDVLNYLTQAIEKTEDSEEKRTLLQKLGDLTNHPIVTSLATTGIEAVVKHFS